jgi:phosphoribosylformylglycinamidine synthase
MKKVKTVILRTAGTNCDTETAYAFRASGADVELVHINALIKEKSMLAKYHILAIPGGFTYGDDIASGKVLANELRFGLPEQLSRFVAAGKLIIGICNGFQVLVKMGLLPDINRKQGYKTDATLSLNDSGRFEDRWVYLKRTREEKCIWTKGLPELVYIPVAHAEGKFIPKDDKTLKALCKNGQIVFRYTDAEGRLSGYPHNPNGSMDNIAGICDPTGKILGMMPHPERHVTYLQHPNWRRFTPRAKGMGIGLEVFKNGVKFAYNNIL